MVIIIPTPAFVVAVNHARSHLVFFLFSLLKLLRFFHEVSSSENPPFQGRRGGLSFGFAVSGSRQDMPPAPPSKGEQFSFIGGAAAGMDGSLEFLAVPST